MQGERRGVRQLTLYRSAGINTLPRVQMLVASYATTPGGRGLMSDHVRQRQTGSSWGKRPSSDRAEGTFEIGWHACRRRVPPLPEYQSRRVASLEEIGAATTEPTPTLATQWFPTTSISSAQGPLRMKSSMRATGSGVTTRNSATLARNSWRKTRPSIRARLLPRQKCSPKPNAM
jgi:hypothetical protein